MCNEACTRIAVIYNYTLFHLYWTNMPRGAVFAPIEKEVLIELTDKYKTVLDSKENNARALTYKKDTWNSLATEFNSSMGVSQRSVKQLKDLWKNLKSRAVRRNNGQTGGGASDVQVGPHTERVCSLLPRQIQSLRNQFDDDATFHGDTLTIKNEAQEPCQQTAPPMPVILSVTSTAPEVSRQTGPARASFDQFPDSDDEETPVTPSTFSSVQHMTQSHEMNRHPLQARGNDYGYKDSFLDLAKAEHDIKVNILKLEHTTKMEMMEKEHKKRMKTMDMEQDVLALKKKKLTQEFKKACGARSNLWQPF